MTNSIDLLPAATISGPSAAPPRVRKAIEPWATSPDLRRVCLEEFLSAAGKRFKEATGDGSPWPFMADAAVHCIEWLLVVDTTTIKHPRLKGCTTSRHGDRVRPFLSALIARTRARTRKQIKAADVRVDKARVALLAALYAGRAE
jgi:hypothetical protein